MGISLGSKTTKSTQTTTPNNPAWVEPQLQGLAGNISSLAGRDPTSFVAPANGLLTKAGQAAQGLNFDPSAWQRANGLFGGLMDAPAPQMKAASLLDNLGGYMSPYTKDVVDSSLADYDFGAGQTRAQNQLALAGSDTFGGSGGAIQTALSNDAITRGRATLSSQLRDQAFNTGANLSNLDSDRRQDASKTNAQLQAQQLALQAQAGRDITNNATSYYDAQKGLLDSQTSIGSILQALEQAKAGAPIDVMSQLAGAYASLPLGLLHGETTVGKSKTSDPMGAISGLLGGVGSLAGGLGALGKAGGMAAVFSDRRLKEDVRKVGERPDGLGIYEFRYRGRPDRYRGVMADEVQRLRPDAYVEMEGGYGGVDYSKLGDR